MAIRCGNCKDYHPTVADVRECHGHGPKSTGPQTATITGRRLGVKVEVTDDAPAADEVASAFNFAPAEEPAKSPAPVVGCTERQATFLDSLFAERVHNWNEEEIAWAKSSKGNASNAISSLLKASKKETASDSAPQLPEVPAGRYALRNVPGYTNEITFFKVDRPTEGRWAGRTFVKFFVSDAEYPVRGAKMSEILARISENVEGAFALYGKETATCGVCGRKLTDDESRARGIGPVCLNKLGF